MPPDNKAAEAIEKIDIILEKYEKELSPHIFDAVLCYLKSKYMQGL
jgi:hypothetical protein